MSTSTGRTIHYILRNMYTYYPIVDNRIPVKVLEKDNRLHIVRRCFSTILQEIISYLKIKPYFKSIFFCIILQTNIPCLIVLYHSKKPEKLSSLHCIEQGPKRIAWDLVSQYWINGYLSSFFLSSSQKKESLFSSSPLVRVSLNLSKP